MTRRTIPPARAAVLGVKTASIASRKLPWTRNADGSIKPRAQREAETRKGRKNG